MKTSATIRKGIHLLGRSVHLPPAKRDRLVDTFKITPAIKRHVRGLIEMHHPLGEVEKALLFFRSIIRHEDAFSFDGVDYHGLTVAEGGLEIKNSYSFNEKGREKHGVFLPNRLIMQQQNERSAFCLEYAFLLVTLLRAEKIEACIKLFLQLEGDGRSRVIARLNGKTYRIDVYNKRIRQEDHAMVPDSEACAAYYLNKGTAFVLHGRIEVGIAMYDRAIALSPRMYYAWNSKGLALLEQGKLGEALTCFERVCEIEPDYLPAWQYRGKIHFRLSRYTESRQSYTRVLELDPQNNEAKAAIALFNSNPRHYA